MSNGQSKQNFTHQRSAHYGNQRNRRAEVVRVFLLAVSLISLAVALLGIVKLVYDIFTLGFYSLVPNIWVQLIIVALAFIIGWVTAFIDIRKYNNLIMPLLIDIFAWGVVVANCWLYGRIMQKLFVQNYTVERYALYWLLLLIGFVILIALELIPEDHKMVLFAIPVFLACLVHLVVIVVHYVFVLEGTILLDYIFADVLLFLGMLGMGLLLLFDMPFLKPLRNLVDRYDPDDRARIQLIDDRR